MATRDYASNDREVTPVTLSRLFLDAVERFGGRTAFRWFESPGHLSDISYAEALDVVRSVAGGLEARGIERGDRVAIMSENRPEWALADYGCLCAGVVDVPIYPTLLAHQVAYVFRDSGVGLVFVSSEEQLAKAREAAAELDRDVTLVMFDAGSEAPDGAVGWESFLEAGRSVAAGWSDDDFRAMVDRPELDDVATMLYTSGTTGDPKGVMLTHGNVGSNVIATSSVLAISDQDRTASFLPLSHIFQRMVDYLFFHVGCPIGYPRSIHHVVEDLPYIKPTVAVSVPRLYEKIYNGVMEADGLKKTIIDWAVGVADRVAGLRLAGEEPGGFLALQYRLADRLVFSKVRDAVGGELKFFVSGGAPLAPALNRFFYSIGLIVLEGYGLTETSPVTNVNTLDDFRIGTVGKPVPGTEVRIAEDGEILVRGPQVMKGYYNNPEATEEAITDDGWFRTGDIGEIDEDDYLRITDRKKDIIVTAGGKNVAPQPIENRLKENRFVDQAVMVGDRRKYVSILIVPNFASLESWARQEGIAFAGREELVADTRVRGFMEAEVKKGFQGLASYETPKRIALLADEFTVENGTLTPKMSVKRRVVQERYDPLIDRLYDPEPADKPVGN